MATVLPCASTQVAAGWDQKNTLLTSCTRNTGQSSVWLLSAVKRGRSNTSLSNTQIPSDFLASPKAFTFLKQKTPENHKFSLYRTLEGRLMLRGQWRRGSSWTGLWETWSSEKCPRPWQGCCTRWSSKVHPETNHPTILWFSVTK